MPTSRSLPAAALSVEVARFLTMDEGKHLVSRISQRQEDSAVRVLDLRKRGVSPEIAAGAVDLAAARRRARFRFPDADRLFFTSESLAQATSPAIAHYHAERLAPLGVIADLGCGVGMDAIALAEAGARHVLAIDRDPVRLIFARANAAVRGIASDRIEFRESDVTTLDWSADAAYWDPSRRDSRGGQRVSHHAEQYEPPLSFLESIKGKVPRGGCVKLSPGLPDDILGGLGGTVSFLSESRECKEACLWFGEAQRQGSPQISAVLLPENIILPGALKDGEEEVPTGPIEAYVFDPDPAVIRARALGPLADRLALHRISLADSYMTGMLPAFHRAASCYRVLHATAYKPRELAPWLRDQGIGRLIVKKRHFSKEPDAVARELRLKGGGREATLIVVRRDEGGHEAILCEPFKNDANL